ncbi:hypothetical protein [Caulobacter sp. NIBR1757]|uniref:hypothetical protein n=1 Tax=Caulobacter sp. NIBR1757 TaxID=3016000 RepID=UPI0022F0374B|nr:hypothetical protein [Caulobacter sp. NIBR1757]WGM37779.1 hypothetical protein AMEJIAPC_00679 [Caulobacter sp. NIBR1757]
MIARRLIAAAALLMLTLAAGRAAACSVTRDYVRPSNFELVAMADAIVVATAEGALAPSGRQGMPEGVRFRVTATLKGAPPETVETAFAAIGQPVASDPTDLAAANAEAYAGPCSRMTYARGGAYVLFLARDDKGALRVIGIPFSRTSEDYLGEASAWIRTIRLYLDVQRDGDPMAQLTRLETLRGELLARGDALSKAQAADILDHLTSRSPWKPTAFLIQTYEALERGETPRYPLRGPEANKELGEAQALTEAMFGREDGPFGRAEQMNSVLQALVLGEHPGAGPFFDRLVASPTLTAGQLGAAIRWQAGNGRLRRAYDLIGDKALGLMIGLDPEATARLIADIASAMQGEAWEDGKEAWHADPVVAAGWPRLAMRIDRHQRLVLGQDRSIGFSGVLEALRPADYRADPEITLRLAEDYDEAVEAWALAQLKAPPHKPAADAEEDDEEGEADNPDRLPIRVLTSSWAEDRNTALVGLFCQGGARRRLVIAGLGEAGDDLAVDLLARFAAFKPLSDDDRDTLVDALGRIYARERAQSGGGLFASDGDDVLALLIKVQRKERPEDAKALPCAR